MDGLRKIMIGTLLGSLSLVGALLVAVKMDDNFTTRTATVIQNEVITISSRPSAATQMMAAPYKTMDTFQSEILKSNFLFTSAGGSWEEVTPKGTHAEAQVKLLINNKWSDWTDLEEEIDPMDTDGNDSQKKYGIISSNPASMMQYRFLLYGDGKSTPIIKNVNWTFIKSGQSINYTPATDALLAASKSNVEFSYLGLLADPSGVIPRSLWGANEQYRYLADNNSTPQLVELDPDFYDKYKDELGYSRVVDADEKGNKYKWPLQYPEEVTKFVVHHTATTGNLDNPPQAIRDIYHYHAITRGWGDIGYNYIVDPKGHIYEGRYGGEGVIGAHSGPGNHSSIGIAILGNYEQNEVPEDVVISLSKLINKKAKIHDIITDGQSMFRGEMRDNIFGHRDIMSTTCPGQYLYDKIPVLRTLSAKYFTEKPKFVNDYAYQDTSEIYYLDLKPFEKRTVTLKLENIGKKDWDSKTYILVSQNDAFNGVISFPTKDGAVLAKLNESSVKSGDTGTFTFDLEASNKGKTVYLNIAPFYNGKVKSEDYLVLPVTIEQASYKYEFVQRYYPQDIMKAGEEFSGWVKLKNTGNVVWNKEGDNRITLKSSSDGKALSLFTDPASATVATLQEDQVGPGETGTFLLTLKSPVKSGYYHQDLKPYIESIGALAEGDMYFETLVYDKDYDAEITAKSSANNFEQGDTYTLNFTLRNIGGKIWTKEDLRLNVAKPKALKVSGMKVSAATVAAGESATISFNVEVPADYPIEEKMLFARVRIGNEILTGKPVQFKYKITASNFQVNSEQEENKIRVKLGYAGNPEITADGTYKVYSGETLVDTQSAGEKATVSYENSTYKVVTADATFLENSPVRFVPQNSAIMQIANFEHRPTWDLTLNDNQYRGTLEVAMDDSALVVINELYLEDYLKGLGEVANNEPLGKIKTVMVAARTYAKFYMTKAEKFPGKPYHLDDNPDKSQKYLGYGLEKRSPNVAKAVNETKGEVVTYNGEVVKTPYFNQSDGTSTKSAQSVWGWTDTPYLVSVSDSYCKGTAFLGHGVGLSGCGAKGMADAGFSYTEILQHYYTGTEITDLY